MRQHQRLRIIRVVETKATVPEPLAKIVKELPRALERTPLVVSEKECRAMTFLRIISHRSRNMKAMVESRSLAELKDITTENPRS
jgi:hypothetical protein